MNLSLRPAVFQKLCQIGTLFQEEKKSEYFYKKKMLKKLSECQFYGQVKLVNQFDSVTGTAAIIGNRRLLFWPAKNIENRKDFDLYGIEKTGWETDGLGMIITNAAGNRFELRFENHTQNEKWNLEMLKVAQNLKHK